MDGIAAGIRRARPELVDAAVVLAALFATIVPAAAKGAGQVDALGYGLLAAGALALGGRRRWPVAVLAITVAAKQSYVALGYPQLLEWVMLLIALVSASAAEKWRWSVVLGGAALGLTFVEEASSGQSLLGGSLVPSVGGTTAAIFLGSWWRARRDYIAAVEQRAEWAERTKEEEARRRVDEERLRIAREVHDTVTHSIATINVQAGVAAHVIEKRPEQAHDALLAIKQASGEALQELRATVGMLRNVDGDSRAPSPGLRQASLIASPLWRGRPGYKPKSPCRERAGRCRRPWTSRPIASSRRR